MLKRVHNKKRKMIFRRLHRNEANFPLLICVPELTIQKYFWTKEQQKNGIRKRTISKMLIISY